MSNIVYDKLDADHWSMKSSDASEHLQFDCRILRDEFDDEPSFLATAWVFGASEPFSSKWHETFADAKADNLDSLEVAEGMVS